jgi:hypothetical protein
LLCQQLEHFSRIQLDGHSRPRIENAEILGLARANDGNGNFAESSTSDLEVKHIAERVHVPPGETSHVIPPSSAIVHLEGGAYLAGARHECDGKQCGHA